MAAAVAVDSVASGAGDAKAKPPAALLALGAVAFDHICIGCGAWADVLGAVGALGGTGYAAGRAPSNAFCWCQWSFAGGSRLECIAPPLPAADANANRKAATGSDEGKAKELFLQRFLRERGPGVHHVTFKVTDLTAARARAEALGFTVVGWDTTSDPSWHEFFLMPRRALGVDVVVQFAQVIAGVPAPPGTDLDPVTPPNTSGFPAQQPARLLGLRMVCADRHKALRLWGELLGGALETVAVDMSDAVTARSVKLAKSAFRTSASVPVSASLCFRFGASPMRVRVDIVPGARWAGPVALEWAAPDTLPPDTPLQLPPLPTPFGAAFFQAKPYAAPKVTPKAAQAAANAAANPAPAPTSKL